MDRLTKQKRSELMGRVGAKNTAPEIKVRSLIHRLGYRFRLHSKKLPGTPDLVFPSRKKVIFVHGCFWHGHQDCPKFRIPKSNSEFWQAKLQANISRDDRNIKELSKLGWTSLVIWQCELQEPRKVRERADAFLRSPCGVNH
jgi:DNA mismatch endonuclease (patch repair protein)